MSWSPENYSNAKELPFDNTNGSYKKMDEPKFNYGAISGIPSAPGAYNAEQPYMQPPIAPIHGSYKDGAGPGTPPSYSAAVNASSSAPVEGQNMPPVPLPSAPPGYENIGFTLGDFLAPPTLFMSSAPSVPPTERPEFSSGPTWTNEEVRQSLIEYVSQFCCYGSQPAKNMNIVKKSGSSASHYMLETFTEGRQVNWTFKPYPIGTMIDGPECGPAPGPWDIPVQITEYFKDTTHKLEIPHTSYVRPCHTCEARGRVTCDDCHGAGKKRCHHCHGTGHRRVGGDRRRCVFCHGSGRDTCRTCYGDGFLTCPSCNRHCNIRFYLELTIQWKNHVEDFVFNESTLPSNLVKDVPGTTTFEETNLRVWPINHFFIPEINQASENLINRHTSAFPSERILQQRQTIRMIPILEVKYTWKNVVSDFFIYGLDKKVYAPKYPSTCCCGCTIL